MSYYNRPWRGNLEISIDGKHWVLGSERPFNSVEAGLTLAQSVVPPFICWRIVDLGGNIYEQGRMGVAA